MKNISRKILSFVLACAMIVPMFIMPLQAETTIQSVTSPAGYENIEIRVTTDKEPLSYRVGDKVTFTMKAYADNMQVSVPSLKYTLEGDGDETHAKLSKTGTLYPDANDVFTLTEDVISIPGYMRITGHIYTGSTKWAETPNDSRDYTLAAGIFVNYESVTPVASMPDDFDEVWDARLAELDAVAPKVLRIDKISTYYNSSTKKTVSASASYDIYAVYVDCIGCEDDILIYDEIGNEKGATWSVAYITVPKYKTADSLSIVQGFLGRGVNTPTPATSSSAINLKMSTHSVVLLDNENAASATAFKDKYTSYINGGASYGTSAESNSALETCYWANMLLRDVQMIRFAKQAFGTEGAASLIDDDTVINGMTKAELNTAIEYWKGLFNGEISTTGGSQGGFQALCTAALAPDDVTSVEANIPSMADNYINTDPNRVQCNTRPAAGEALRYVETSFLARRIKAPVTISAGLVDRTCAPIGIMCIWNTLVETHAQDEDYKASITFVQSRTHGYTPAYPGNQAPTIYTYEQLEPQGVSNSDIKFAASGYRDIDGETVDQDALPPSTGYIQIGTNVESEATVTGAAVPYFYYMGGARTYFNAELKKLVLVTTGTPAGNYNYEITTPSQNINAEGGIWRLAYWAKKNSANVEALEIRYGTGGSQLAGIGYFTSQLTSVKTYKIDVHFNKYNWGGNSSATSVFTKMPSLVSAGHGTFAADGTFTAASYVDGVVDLRGFTQFSDSDFGYSVYGGLSVKEAVTNKLCGTNMFESCANLKKVTVPSTGTLTSIGKNCFDGCSRLEEINIECTLSSLTIGSNAFGGNAVTINVKTDADKAIVTNALTAAGISNVTVLSAGEEPPAEEEETYPIPPAGIKNTNADFTKSNYSDIDSGAGYVQIGTKTKSNATVGEDFIPRLYYFNGANAYYNAAQKKLVMVSTGTMTAASENKVDEARHKNVNEVGGVWYLAYWVDQNSAQIKEVEFRRGSNGTTFNYFGYFSWLLKNVETVKIDSRLYKVTNSNASTSSVFGRMTSLKTAGHGDFAADGTFTPVSYVNNVVDLTGFTDFGINTTSLTEYASKYAAYTVYQCLSVTNAVTNVLAASLYEGCTALTSVTLKNSDALSVIDAKVFKDCSALETITVNGSVSSAVTVDASAFSGTNAINIVVQTAADRANLEAALATAGVANVTVILAKEEVKEAQNAIVSEGFSVRMKDYTGLRALFSFDFDVAALNELNGLTLVSYGVFASSYNRFVNTYESDEDALFAAARKVTDNTGTIKYVPVYNADGTGANKYIDYDARTFCIALTDIESANAMSDIYMAGYAIWVDKNGNESYTITTYNMSDGEKAVNLYEITLGLTKNGLINSGNTDDVCFWQTLKVGALKTNAFNTAYDSTTKGYTLPTDGYFTYLDVDYHAYTGNTSSDGYAFNPTGVDEQGCGVVWSVLKYTDDEYVLVLRNKDKETYKELSIPQHTANTAKYYFYAPYDYRYGDAKKANNAALVTYNPTLTQANYDKIKTMVVDHGITASGVAAFSGLTKVETLVYPDGMRASGHYKFIGSSGLKNIIWCHADENGNPVEHMSDFEGLTSLFDLRGLSALDIGVVFRGCSSVENIVLPKTLEQMYVEAMFTTNTSLRRAWVDGYEMPADGTIDLTPVRLKRLSKGIFAVGDKIHTIKLPTTITDIYMSFAVTNTDNTCWMILGENKSMNYVCSESVAALLAEYVSYIRSNPRTAKPETGNYADNISINGKPVLTIINGN